MIAALVRKVLVKTDSISRLSTRSAEIHPKDRTLTLLCNGSWATMWLEPCDPLAGLVRTQAISVQPLRVSWARSPEIPTVRARDSLPRVVARRPSRFPRAPMRLIRAAVGMRVAQVGVGKPHHQPCAGDVVHRRLLMWRHAHPHDDDGFVFEFDFGVGETGWWRRGRGWMRAWARMLRPTRRGCEGQAHAADQDAHSCQDAFHLRCPLLRALNRGFRGQPK